MTPDEVHVIARQAGASLRERARSRPMNSKRATGRRGLRPAHALAAALAIAGVAFVVGDAPVAPVRLTTPETSPAQEPLLGRWEALPPSPLEPRANHVAVWTGAEIIVWGGNWTEPMDGQPGLTRTGMRREADGSETPLGERSLSDGAAYSPTTRTWRRISEAPIFGSTTTQALWTGTEMVVLGVEDGSLKGAAYHPGEDRWRLIAQPPIEGALDASLAWTGDKVLLWGAFDHQPDRAPVGAMYDPAQDAWALVPPAPVDARQWRASAWTGEELLVWGGTDWNRQEATPMGAAFKPASLTWRRLPDGPLAGGQWLAGSWTGSEFVVLGAQGAAALDPETRSWRRLPDGPFPHRQRIATPWTSRYLLVWGGASPGGNTIEGGMAYEPAADRWHALPESGLGPRCGHVAVWAKDRLFVWGGQPACGEASPARGDGAIWQPTR